jgi:hypothetical protein
MPEIIGFVAFTSYNVAAFQVKNYLVGTLIAGGYLSWWLLVFGRVNT